MVRIDAGAHLRSSGAEDLLHWSAEQWAAARPERPALPALPKR